MTPLRESFGGRVRELRKSMGLTQEELAEKACMEYKYLGAIERGEKNLTINNIEKIAKGFGIEVHQLFTFAFESLMPEEKVTEEKIKELLTIASKETKEILLNILFQVLKLTR